MGFLLDRMALTAAAHPGFLGAAARGESLPAAGELGEGSGDGGWANSGGSADAVELEVEFLMVAFSAAVNTTPAERMQQVHTCTKKKWGVGLFSLFVWFQVFEAWRGPAASRESIFACRMLRQDSLALSFSHRHALA